MSQIAQPKSLEVSMADCDFRSMLLPPEPDRRHRGFQQGGITGVQNDSPIPKSHLFGPPLRTHTTISPSRSLPMSKTGTATTKQVVGIAFSRASISCTCHYADCLYLLCSPFLKRRLVDRPTEFVERLQPTNDAVKAKNLRYTFLFLRLPQKLGECPPKIAGPKSSGLRI